MNVLAIIQLISAILPLIIQIVQSVEMAIGAGNGKVKMEMVKNILQTAMDSGTVVTVQGKPTTVSYNDISPKIEPVVNAVVSGLNAAGQFSKSPQAALSQK